MELGHGFVGRQVEVGILRAPHEGRALLLVWVVVGARRRIICELKLRDYGGRIFDALSNCKLFAGRAVASPTVAQES